ncbi:MAG: hypothetical protein LKI24_09165 [Acidipropionibacterium sp.]|jgi:hypothetical protein|nr:hypothetical protein [Acidipropionibacterium sp.]
MNRMPRPLRSFRLTVYSATNVLLAPLAILGVVVAVSVLIVLIIGIQSGLPLTPEASMEMNYNMGAILSIPGFLVALGALTVNRQFATALAFGSTRRDFWLGSSLGFLVVSLVTGIGSVLLLWLEKATDYWFIGARALDVFFLGQGDPWQTFLTITAVCLCSLFLGAGFGTVFRAWGHRAVLAAAIGLGLVLCGGIALTVWQWDSWVPTLAPLGAWLVTIGTAALGVIAAAGSFVVNRRSTI